MKTLVVDDSSTMRRIVINALNQMGQEINVVEAEDGQDGYAKYEENKDVELILCDWNMPNMNGFELLEKLVGEGCKAPIIMVTTEAEKENVIKAIKAGAKNYITKPFTPDMFVTKVKQTLGIS